MKILDELLRLLDSNPLRKRLQGSDGNNSSVWVGRSRPPLSTSPTIYSGTATLILSINSDTVIKVSRSTIDGPRIARIHRYHYTWLPEQILVLNNVLSVVDLSIRTPPTVDSIHNYPKLYKGDAWVFLRLSNIVTGWPQSVVLEVEAQ